METKFVILADGHTISLTVDFKRNKHIFIRWIRYG